MTSAAVMTFATLQTDLQRYTTRSDATYVSDIPRLIMQAENKIASEARGLGYLTSVTGVFVPGYPGGQAFQKPSLWRETASFAKGTGSGFNTYGYLYERTVEYCRRYWPTPTTTAEPKFYADWDYAHWLIAPTPDQAYNYEIIYHQRPTPLDDNNQTNWTTQNAPQLILAAAMVEAVKYTKRVDLKQMWDGEYDRALKQVAFEQKRRLADRANSAEQNA